MFKRCLFLTDHFETFSNFISNKKVNAGASLQKTITSWVRVFSSAKTDAHTTITLSTSTYFTQWEARPLQDWRILRPSFVAFTPLLCNSKKTAYHVYYMSALHASLNVLIKDIFWTILVAKENIFRKKNYSSNVIVVYNFKKHF